MTVVNIILQKSEIGMNVTNLFLNTKIKDGLILANQYYKIDVLNGGKIMNKLTKEEQAFIEGIELAIDWNLPIPKEDYEKYCELINKRKET